MGIVVSLLLIGVGAILIWGVTGELEGVDVDAIGVILIVIGVLSFALTLFFWSSWWGPGYFGRSRYAEGDPHYGRRAWGPRRRAVIEEDVPPAGPPPDAPPPP
ncbi:MAG: hypothetical protein M3229_02265 [Actinomycetota bacterium]|nr:hypothetical protein [Actinomycetota bacterium]